VVVVAVAVVVVVVLVVVVVAEILALRSVGICQSNRQDVVTNPVIFSQPVNECSTKCVKCG
jgi:hypothetical protein